MKEISIAFTDFWPSFNPQDNFIINLLRKEYSVNVVDAEDAPDILFYSFFGHPPRHFLAPFGTIKVYYTGENDIPNFNICDYAISFHQLHFGRRHFRLPIYTLYPAFDILRKGTYDKRDENEMQGFCSALISNSEISDPYRLKFLDILNSYKQVASGGLYANNVGGRVADKHSFIKRYKFNVAFENSLVDGYTTEKLIEALAARTLPLYWGNPNAAHDINPKCFINIHDFSSPEAALEYIKEVDNDEGLYNQYFTENPLKNSPCLNWESELSEFLSYIVENRNIYRTQYGGMGKIYAETQLKQRLYNVTDLRRTINGIERAERFKNKLLSYFRR